MVAHAYDTRSPGTMTETFALNVSNLVAHVQGITAIRARRVKTVKLAFLPDVMPLRSPALGLVFRSPLTETHLR